MAKQLDASKLVIGIKKDFRKDADEKKKDNIENAVRQIHDETPVDVKQIKAEPTKRTSLDIPKSIHKKICQRVLDNDLTIKDYLLDLITKDLKN